MVQRELLALLLVLGLIAVIIYAPKQPTTQTGIITQKFIENGVGKIVLNESGKMTEYVVNASGVQVGQMVTVSCNKICEIKQGENHVSTTR